MLNIKCDKCKKEIDEKGAILWSPPNNDEMCKKIHLCTKCYKIVMKYIGS